MTAAERIDALLKQFSTNVKTFSELCGYERPQAFYDIQKGKTRNISLNMCERITAVFPSVNRIWLMTGEGDMLIDHKSDEAAVETQAPSKCVPLVEISAIAGPLKAYYEGGVELQNCRQIRPPFDIQADLAIPISGDSMEPQYPDGALAFIRRINEAAFIPWGNVLVIDTENGTFIKRIMPDDGDSHYIVAESINPKYPPMRVPKSSVYGMYRILNVSKTYSTL